MSASEEPDLTAKGDGQLMHEAAHWFARMRGPEADDIRAEFETWMARGALHRAAYNQAAEIFALGKFLAEDAALPGRAAPAADIPPSAPERPATARRLALALVALLAFAMVAMIWFAGRTANPGPAVAGTDDAPGIRPVEYVATAPGSLRLADGSRVDLAAGTRVSIRMDAARRLIELLQGEARFQVQHDGRPFEVRAAGGTVAARGTLFEVGLAPDRRVRVRLLEGAVDVAVPTGGGAPEVRRMRPGETIAYAGTGVAAAPSPAGRGIDMSAGTGMMADLDAVPLGQLVARVNRGTTPPIRLADPALGELRVSGRLRLDDTQRLAIQLARLLDLEAEPRAGEIVLDRD